MHEAVGHYRECAATCQETDYGDKSSVRRHNRAARTMYEIVGAAVRNDVISAFVPLLDDPVCSKWLAHQLLEKADVDAEVEQRCLRIIEALAASDSADAMGEQIWLRDYKKRTNTQQPG